MTDKLRAAAQAALEALINGKNVRAGEGGTKRQSPLEDAAIEQLRAALAELPVKESLTTHPSIIDSIADHLVADHVALMNENRQLRESLREILYEIYPPEHYTDETIEYEMGQGNMMMPAVKRAYALVGRESHD